MSEEFGGNLIVLTDDEGNEFELEHLDTLEYEDETYMAFTPVTGEDDENPELEIIILKVQEEDGDEILETVDDEDLLDRVYEVFMQRAEEAEKNGEVED